MGGSNPFYTALLCSSD